MDNGQELRTIQFCPWCGADKREPDKLTVAARDVVATRYANGEWDELNEAIGNLGSILCQQGWSHPSIHTG